MKLSSCSERSVFLTRHETLRFNGAKLWQDGVSSFVFEMHRTIAFTILLLRL